MSINCQWINTSDSIGHIMTWNRLSEALMVCIVKTWWLLCRVRVNGINRQIDLRKKDKMVSCRGLIVDCRVKIDEAHDPWSIELQSKDV